MNIIIGNPGSGKTKKILELSARNSIPVLCESEERVQRLLYKAMGYGYKIPTPIYVKELTDDVKNVYIDDIEKLLSVLITANISAITINTEVEVLNLDNR
jgi:hypothetical protein